MRILLVDADPISNIVMLKLLEREGYPAVHVDNPQDALEKLAAEDFRAVLLETRLPTTSGFELTKLIRSGAAGAKNIGIHIVAVTACVMLGDREQCILAGMDDHLPKPVMFEELKAMLARIPARPLPA